jgi:hypothetical protein
MNQYSFDIRLKKDNVWEFVMDDMRDQSHSILLTARRTIY